MLLDGRSMRMGLGMCVIVAGGLVIGPAHGEYLLTPQSNGSSSVVIAPGQSFALDVLLTSDAGDVHNSAIFLIAITAPGLVLESYAWASPYETGGIFDASTPPFGSLPLVIDSSILQGPAYPPGFIGFELANVVPIPGGVFATGVIVTIEFFVPEDWLKMGPESVFISVIPDTLAHGFEIIPTAAGPAFELIIIPAPGVGVVVLLGLVAFGARGRRRITTTC